MPPPPPPFSVPLPDPNEWNGSSAAPSVAVALTLAVTAVGLRFWARAGILRVTGLEDWFILAALGFSIGCAVCLGLCRSSSKPNMTKTTGALTT
jgi:hypothetical protein